jgi:hypothetical protein
LVGQALCHLPQIRKPDGYAGRSEARQAVDAARLGLRIEFVLRLRCAFGRFAQPVRQQSAPILLAGVRSDRTGVSAPIRSDDIAIACWLAWYSSAMNAL